MTTDLVGLTEGRIVHYVLSNSQHRAALIVRNWQEPSGSVNLYVFLDGRNDSHNDGRLFMMGVLWATSVPYDGDGKVGTWHWPERGES